MKKPKIKNFHLVITAQVGRKKIDAFIQQTKTELNANIKIDGNIILEQNIKGDKAIQTFLQETFLDNLEGPISTLMSNPTKVNIKSLIK